jgi:hypothetical protein
MYLRFITSFADEYNMTRTGVFQAAGYLRRNNDIHYYDKCYLNEVWEWFAQNLNAPAHFKARKPKKASHLSVCWFKNTANEHLGKMYEMIEILEKYDIMVTRIKRHNPGYIIYEDEFQVSSIPYKNDRVLTV